MGGLRSAIAFLTIFPVAPRDASSLAMARMWFPLVGLLLGLVLAMVDLLIHWGYPVFADEARSFAPLFLASILMVLLAILTRALHLDGFMDCCDAFFGGFSQDRRLDILRDSHVGAFAVVGVVGLLLVKVGAIMALPSAGRFWILLLFPCLSRWGMLVVLELFPYARRQGIGVPFQPTGSRWQMVLGLAVAVAAALALAGPAGLALLVAATLVALGLGWWSCRLLGGVTGDVYGAVNELAEAVVLVVAAFLMYYISDSFFQPIHLMFQSDG